MHNTFSAILNEASRAGFGPAKLHIDTFNKGDEGFGMLEGLRFDAVVGKNGEKAGQDGADGKYVAPKAHIIVTTQTLLNDGCAATNTDGARTSRTCRSRSARR